jgi:hypothetical protein
MKHKLPSSPWCVAQVSLEKKLVDEVAIEEDLQVTAGEGWNPKSNMDWLEL